MPILILKMKKISTNWIGAKWVVVEIIVKIVCWHIGAISIFNRQQFLF